MPIHPDATIGAVRLAVSDLDRAVAFYERTVGLPEMNRDGGTALLGVDAGAPLVELSADPRAPARPPGTTGLFHLAILVAGRRELARALRRVTETGWRLSGASDHLVSEALYLRDPERNGIEIYCDRPRAQWSRAGGEIGMATLPLDLDGVMSELDDAGDAPAGSMGAGARIGHVHLNVADLHRAEAFYHGLLGLDVTVRSYPGALFLSAGGYHHHIAVNTWEGEGAPAPPDGARGLRWFELVLPDGDELERATERLLDAGVDVTRSGEAVLVADPSRNRLRLRSRA